MTEWLPDEYEPEDGTLADSAADATGTVIDWGASPVQQATGVGPTASETVDFLYGAYATPPEEGEEYNQDAVLTGPARDAYDYVQDYDGEWGGQEDQHDLAGPSIDWSALANADSDEPVFRQPRARTPRPLLTRSKPSSRRPKARSSWLRAPHGLVGSSTDSVCWRPSRRPVFPTATGVGCSVGIYGPFSDPLPVVPPGLFGSRFDSFI